MGLKVGIFEILGTMKRPILGEQSYISEQQESILKIKIYVSKYLHQHLMVS